MLRQKPPKFPVKALSSAWGWARADACSFFVEVVWRKIQEAKKEKAFLSRNNKVKAITKVKRYLSQQTVFSFLLFSTMII